MTNMKTIGFPISMKENEKRRALVPPDLNDVKNNDKLYFESGYGDTIGYSDIDYLNAGVNVVDINEVYDQDIICNPKVPEHEERKLFKEGQTLFGWIHAVQGRDITDFLLEKKMSAIAWEEMYKDNRHVFWRNQEIAGEAGVIHASLYFGKLPYNCSVAILGNGMTARGAVRILEKMGTKITIYDRKTSPFLRKELEKYDIIVNCVLWDLFRKDRLIYREDLKRMKKGAMIIDISCDDGFEIETSHPTSINNPVYYVDGVLHYVVDHTPALFWKSSTEFISGCIKEYIDDLIEEKNNEVLQNATIIKHGKILDQDITKFQGR